jgi:acyl carrier protein
VEEKLAQIWSEVLAVERVGVYDDFFELGGHSLLATQVAARVRKTFEVTLPLRELFEATTIAALAESVQRIFLNELGKISEEEAVALA